MNVVELKSRARELAAKGRLEKAEVLYRQVLTRVPRDASAWLRHAEVLKRLGRASQAALSYRSAATILLSLGYEARAVASLRLALALLHDDVDLVADIIRIEMHQKKRSLPRTAQVIPTRPVSLADLSSPQLALPMLTEVDPRPSADSIIVSAASLASAPDPLPPPDGVALNLVVQRDHEVWPQVRRLSDREAAIKASKTAKWIVVSSRTPIDVRFTDELAIDEETPWLE